MKVLFAVPRSYNPKQMYREYPLGVGFLGTVLKQQGHDIRIFDQNAEGSNDTTLLSHVAEFQPAVVGFSVITPNYPVAKNQIRALKLVFRWNVCFDDQSEVPNLFPERLQVPVIQRHSFYSFRVANLERFRQPILCLVQRP